MTLSPRSRRSPLVASLLAMLLVVGLAAPATVLAGTELSTTTVAASDPTPTYGTPVTFTATVSGASGMPTGTVQFQVDTVDVGSPVALDGSGEATYATSSLGAGAHTITANYSGDATYDISNESTGVTVGMKQLSVDAVAHSRVYGASDPTLTWTYSGFVSGDNAGNSGITGAASCDRDPGETVAGSPYTITCDPGTLAAPNYTFATGSTAAFTITVLSVAPAITASGKVYDGTTTATITGRSLGGVLGGDTVTLTGGTATFANKNVGTAKTVTATGFTLAGVDAANYALSPTSATTTANITVRTLVVSATGVNKVYDGLLTATVTLSDNRVAGDVLSDNYASAAFANANVGTGKTVTVSGISIGGTDAANYTLDSTSATTTANITAASLTPHVTTVNKVYDGTAGATITGRSLTGVFGTDDVTLTGGTAAFADKNVGTAKTVTATGFTLAGADAANYALSPTSATTTANITARPLTVTAVTGTKVYDGTTSSAGLPTITSGSLATGDSAIWSQAYDTKSVGTGKTLTPAGTVSDGNSGANYAVTFTPVTTGVITVRTLVVSATGVNKVYDGLLTATVTLSDNRVAGDVLSDNYASAAFANANVGTGKTVTVSGISIGGTDAANYSANTTASTTANITLRPLTVTADPKSKIYGTADPALTYAVTSGSLASGDAFSGSLARAAGENVGAYAIGQGTLSAGSNYTFTYVGANLTVMKATSSTALSSEDATSVFGQPVTFTATVSGVGAGTATGTVQFTIDGAPADGPVAVTGGQAKLTTASLAVGSHTVTATYGGDANVNGSSGNLAGGEAVGKASTSVALASDDATSTYAQGVTFTATVSATPPGAGTPTGTVQFRVDGLNLGTPVAMAAGQATLATSAIVVGTHEITAVYGGDGSFTGSFAPLAGGQDVAKATLRATANNKTRAYGITNPTLDATISGFVNGETLATSGVTGSPSLTTTATPASPVSGSPYAITCTQGTLAAANYGFAFVAGRLTVVPATPVVTFVSSVNPAPPTQPVTLTATVTGPPVPGGTITFQAWNGSAFVTFGSATLTTGFSASTAVTLPSDLGNHRYRAVFTSADSNYANANRDLVQSIGKSDVTVTITASRPTWETNVPLTFTATIAPSATGITVPITGSVAFTVDGGLPQTIVVVAGAALLPARALALGPHTITAAYSGDDRFLAEVATPLTRTVVANVVNATGVGVSGSTIYPYKDTWRDTVAIRGTRNEPLSVTIKIYSPSGKLLSTRTRTAGTGAYSSTWTGRTSSGTMLPAGKYRIVQTLSDPSNKPKALTKSWTSYVTLSTKRMYWKTVSLYKNGNAPSTWSGPPSLLSSTRYSNGARLITPTSLPGWAAFGYSFTLPSATTVTKVAFYVQGGPWSGANAPKIGLHDWRTGTSWAAMYDGTRTRKAVGASTTSWYGISGDPAVVVRSVSGKRYVRGFVDTGGWVTGFRYELAKVKLVITYGVLK